jgi:hypothetical protein
MTAQEVALLTDSSLSTDARIVALALLARGEGWHELSREEVCDLLSAEAGRDRAQRAVGQLARRGIVDKRAGGRGHADVYRIKEPSNPAPKVKEPDQAVPKPVKEPDQAVPKRTAVGGGDDGTPLNPPVGLDERTEQAIEEHEDKLRGCRGALRDYLLVSVPTPARRYAYVRSIATWMNGGDPNIWRREDGSQLPEDRRAGLLASALNELAAGEEAKMKRPLGDPANLRTKISILIDPPRKSFPRRRAASDAPQSFEYDETKTFKGFTP